jgi:ABC-2 type transport system permease protein
MTHATILKPIIEDTSSIMSNTQAIPNNDPYIIQLSLFTCLVIIGLFLFLILFIQFVSRRTSIGWSVAAGLMVNVAAVLWACGIAMRFRTLQAGPLMQVPVFLILFLAPVYVPLELLTGWIHAVASVNPATFLLEAGRGLFAGEPTEVGAAFAIALGAVALLTLWALRGLKSAERAG